MKKQRVGQSPQGCPGFKHMARMPKKPEAPRLNKKKKKFNGAGKA